MMSSSSCDGCDQIECIGNIPILYTFDNCPSNPIQPCKIKLGHQIIQAYVIQQIIQLLQEANMI